MKKNKRTIKERNKNKNFFGFRVPAIRNWLDSLEPLLEKIEDPRGKQGQKYPLSYILKLYLISCLISYSDCTNAEAILKEKIDIIAEFIPEALELGIPSHDCFCDALAVVEMKEIQKLFNGFNALICTKIKDRPAIVETSKIEWTKAEENRHRNGRPYRWEAEEKKVEIKAHLSIDGKSSKAATNKKAGKNTPYTGSFFDTGAGLFTEVRNIENGKEKGEATVMRKALEELDLHGTIITADALHTSTETMEAIHSSGGEFLLRLKTGSHKEQCSLIRAEMKEAKKEAEIDRKRQEATLKWGGEVSTPGLDRFQEKTFLEVDKARITKTTLQVVDDTNNICTEYSPYINQVVCLKTVIKEKMIDEDGEEFEMLISEYECCFMISCFLTIDQIYQFVKEHWDIETAHWVLDNYLKEDRSTGRTGNQIYNRAVFKRMAYNLLKMLEECLPETKEKSTSEKFIYLSEHFYCAIMLVIGYREDYCEKMAKVYEKRSEAYSKLQSEIGPQKITLIKM